MTSSGRRHDWRNKFLVAFRGLWLGARRQRSFVVHWTATAAVCGLGWALKIPASQWAILAVAVALVMTAEYFNSALESLAKAVDSNYNEDLRDALDTASGAVLFAALAAVALGLLTLGPPLWEVARQWLGAA